jgi:outer membrane usher protein
LLSTADRLARLLRCGVALGLATSAAVALPVAAAEAPAIASPSGGAVSGSVEQRRTAGLAALLGTHRPAPNPAARGRAEMPPPSPRTAVDAVNLESLSSSETPPRGIPRWIEWTLAVTLNGDELGERIRVIEAPEDGRLAVAAALLATTPVGFERDRLFMVDGVAFVPLEAIAGIQARLDAATLTLALSTPAVTAVPPTAALPAPSRVPEGAAAVPPTAPIPAVRPTGRASVLESAVSLAAGLPGQASLVAAARPTGVIELELIEQLEALEPAAGITFRRDPILPPLLEEERWIEWVLSVTLNGRVIPAGVVVIEEPGTGRLAVELGAAEAWRVFIDRDAILTFEGVPFLPLDAIPGIEITLDSASLVLELEVPPEAFESSRFALDDGERLQPTPGTGAFFDYDLLVTSGQSVSDQLDGLFETGLFASGNVLLGNLRVQDAAGDPDVQRLETTYSRDFPDRRATFRLGDSLTVGGAFAQGLRFGGLQWSTNFATDPAFVAFPLPTIGGLAEQDSVVDVIVDNLTRATEAVPPGPFAIENVPVVTGGGEVQLRVTDLLGRERLVTQSYYVSTRLLKEGLSDFSYEAGFQRRDFGDSSFDYGDFLTTGTHRYGFTDKVTGEIHGEAETDRVSLVAGGAVLLGSFGVVTGGAGASFDDDAGEGAVGQLAYEYVDRRFSIGVRSRYTSSDFRQAAGDDGRLQRVDQLNVGYDTLVLGRLGLLLLNQERHETEYQRSATASYSLPIGPGSLIINAARTLEPDRDYAVTAAYSVPLGPTRSLTGLGRLSSNSDRARLQYSRTRGASELGLDYRLATEVGDDNRPIDARIGYQSRYFGTDADIERFSGDNRFRFGVNGSASVVDGTFGFSRRIGRAFGLVDLPGFPNVRVFLDNREAGKTDADGKLLLPNLRPYEANRVSLAVDDLPLTADLVVAETAAVPYDRSGMTIDFGILAVQRATVILRDGNDQPLPAGQVIASDDGKVEALIGRDGYTQLTGALDERRYLAGSANGRRFVCALPAAPAGDPLPHLGDVRCAD